MIVAGTRSWIANERFNSECEVLNRPIARLNGAVGWRTDFGPSDGSAGESAAVIYLENTAADDDMLRYIAMTFPDIYELHLDGTRVSDEGLQHLHRLTSLTSVTLNNAQVTTAGAERTADDAFPVARSFAPIRYQKIPPSNPDEVESE